VFSLFAAAPAPAAALAAARRPRVGGGMASSSESESVSSTGWALLRFCGGGDAVGSCVTGAGSLSFPLVVALGAAGLDARGRTVVALDAAGALAATGCARRGAPARLLLGFSVAASTLAEAASCFVSAALPSPSGRRASSSLTSLVACWYMSTNVSCTPAFLLTPLPLSMILRVSRFSCQGVRFVDR